MNDIEKTRLAEQIDAHVKALRRTGVDDATLFVAMSAFKRLVEASSPGELDRLAARFPNLRDYAVLFPSISAALRNGAIKVPTTTVSGSRRG